MNQLAHFAIHAADVQRAAKFYESVFNWKCAGYEAAGVTENEFVQILGEGRKVQGAIQSRKFNPISSDLVGFECSFNDCFAQKQACDSSNDAGACDCCTPLL